MIQLVQLKTFVIQRQVNASVKMALEAQSVINVHLDFLEINTYLLSDVILAIVMKKEL